MPPKRGSREFLEAFSSSPLLRMVTSRIADSVAAVPWKLFVYKPGGIQAKRHDGLRRLGPAHRKSMMDGLRESGDLQEIESHPFLDVLDKANEYHTGHGVRKISQVSIDTIGEFFWLKQRNGVGAPTGIWPLPAQWVIGTPTPTHRFFRVSFRGWTGEIPDTEIFWAMDLDPSFPYGRGTGTGNALTDDLEADKYAAIMAKSRFYNQMRPDFLVTSDGLSDADTRRLERDWARRNQGFWNAAKAYFLNRDVKVHEFDVEFRAQQFVQLREFERTLVTTVFGVPPEILGQLDNSNRACYDSETECLTANGWRRQEHLRDDDEVAAYDPVRHSIRFERPWQIVRYQYDGEMLQFSSYGRMQDARGNVDMCVTPDHRMLVRRADAPGRWETRHADALGSRRRAWRVITAAPLEAEHPDPVVFKGYANRPRMRPDVSVPAETWAAMLGLLAAEGSWKIYHTSNPGRHSSYQISVSQSSTANPDKVRQIDALVSAFPIRASRYVDRAGVVRWQWNHRTLVEHLLEHCGTSAATKRLPAYVRQWPGWLQRRIIEWAILGDGTAVGRRRIGSWQLVSTSPGLMQDYQEAATKGGLRTGKIRHQYFAKGNRQTCYRLGISEHVERELPLAQPVPYRGTVWCLETTTGWFVTRRNGCVAIQGNTITAAETIFSKYVLVPRLEFWRSQLQERFLPEYDDRLLLDYVSPVPDDVETELEAAKVAPWAMSLDEWRARMGLEPIPDGKGEKVYVLPLGATVTAEEDLLNPKTQDEKDQMAQDLAAQAPTAPAGGNGNGGPPKPKPAAPPASGKGWAEQVFWDLYATDARLFREAGDVEAEAWLLRRAVTEPESALHAIADKLEPRLRAAFLRAVEASRAAIDLERIAQYLQSGQIDHAAAQAGIGALTHGLAGVTPILQAGFAGGGEYAAQLLTASGLAISFDLTNPRAQEWAGRYSSQLITGVSEDTKAGVRRLIEQAFRDGLHPYETARRVKDWVGLTARQQDAVASFASRLHEQGVDPEKVEARAARYAGAQLRYRAQMIARTETLASSNHGQQELWQQARESGLLTDARTQRVWLVTDDDRLERRCESLADQHVGLDQPFTADDGEQVMTPPLHPNCRCTVGLEIA